MYGHA